MKPYLVVVRRTSYEMIQVHAENETQATELARKNEGIRTFKADDKLEVLAIKEGSKGDSE